MPSLSTISGMGEKAAALLKETAKETIFMSIDDIKNLAKTPKAALLKMKELGILDNLPDSNQMNLFDYIS